MPSWMRLSLAAAGTILVLGASAARAADCNGNGADDAADVATGASPDCNRNLVPDECDVRPVSYGLALDREILLDGHGTSVLAGDLDADGWPDLAVAHGFATGMTLLWNDGAGGLEQRTIEATEDPPDLVAAADLEGDGDLDFALAGAKSVSFFRNDGDRRLSPETGFRLGFPGKAIAAADLDRDGDADLALAGPFEVLTLLRAAGGAYEESQVIPVGSEPATLLALDVDADGDLDLATGNTFGNVSILINDGGGLFAPPRNYATGGAARRLEAADIDGDGDPDLVVLFPVAPGGHAVAVLENSGKGSFEAGDPVPIAVEAVAILPADAEGDGDIDLVLPSTWIAFVQNHGGNLAPVELFPQPRPARAAASADLDGDGSVDAVVSRAQATALIVFERVPWQNRPDCNRDGVPDDCQLDANDCNGNRAPDECDIAAGTSRDCNANGKPDECEPDCNGNGVPDHATWRPGRAPTATRTGSPTNATSCRRSSSSLRKRSTGSPSTGPSGWPISTATATSTS